MMQLTTKAQEIELALPYIKKFDSKKITLAEFKKAIGFKWFRICCFYFIRDADGNKVRFRPNQAQTQLYRAQHKKDIILKARQLGFTTLKMILDLDSCLFIKNYIAGCIAHGDKPARDIYRNKIQFAYKNIKQSIVALLAKAGYKLPKPIYDRDNLYVFDNGSEIGVSVGYRSGTLQSLHVSEFGKICKKFPDRAKEIVAGAFPAASGANSTITIESTAEGKKGYFFEYCRDAKAIYDQGFEPFKEEFKFHFFPWWRDSKYQTDSPADYSPIDNYFSKLEALHNITLTTEQKAWYYLNYKTYGDKMGQEYPSTPEEAFEQAVEGAYYAKQLSAVYKEGRYIDDYYDNKSPVHTAWDIGIGDSTSIWFYQKINGEIHIIYYLENSGEPMGFYIKELEKLAKAHKWKYGKHWGPHDIDHKEWSSEGVTRREQAKKGVLYGDVKYKLRFEVVPRLGIDDGIEHARRTMDRCVFFTGLGGKIDKENGGMKCGVEHGVECLANYRKVWDDKNECYRNTPLHDWSSHGSDAFRYLSTVECKKLNESLPIY